MHFSYILQALDRPLRRLILLEAKFPSLPGRVLDEMASGHEPVLITGPRSNAVLVGEEDWNSIQETLYLLSVPGMRESIAEGLATPIDQCEKEPGW